MAQLMIWEWDLLLITELITIVKYWNHNRYIIKEKYRSKKIMNNLHLLFCFKLLITIFLLLVLLTTRQSQLIHLHLKLVKLRLMFLKMSLVKIEGQCHHKSSTICTLTENRSMIMYFTILQQRNELRTRCWYFQVI